MQAPGFPRGTVIKTKPRVERNRVLVTGGAGFVGSHLCEYLVNRGDHVSEGGSGAYSCGL
jgi:NADPH:quinone reductase-like Zn-dependent oxidoreductase